MSEEKHTHAAADGTVYEHTHTHEGGIPMRRVMPIAMDMPIRIRIPGQF